MKKNYEAMTVEELEEVKQDIGNQIRALREEQHKAQIVWNSRQDEIKARKIAASLSDKEKASLAQVLSPKGIATKEGVGEPGS